MTPKRPYTVLTRQDATGHRDTHPAHYGLHLWMLQRVVDRIDREQGHPPRVVRGVPGRLPEIVELKP